MKKQIKKARAIGPTQTDAITPEIKLKPGSEGITTRFRKKFTDQTESVRKLVTGAAKNVAVAQNGWILAECLYRDAHNYKYSIRLLVPAKFGRGDEIVIQDVGWTQDDLQKEIGHPYDTDADHNYLEITEAFYNQVYSEQYTTVLDIGLPEPEEAAKITDEIARLKTFNDEVVQKHFTNPEQD